MTAKLKQNDFTFFSENAKKQGFKHWRILFKKNKLNFPRLAIRVSKKYGIAVERNRLRRLLKEAFRKVKTKIGNWDLLIIARPRDKKQPKDKKIHEQEVLADFNEFIKRHFS